MAAAAPSSSAELLRLTAAAWVARAIGVAAALGLADLLADGPRGVDELARASAADPPSLYRLLRALAGAGIFAEDDHGRFGLTPLADGLRSDAPGSVRALCALRAAPWYWGAWGELAHSVRTGAPGFDRVHGTDLFTLLERHPAALALFGQAMGALSGTEAAAVLAAYDFAPAATIVDVGGGRGALLAAILGAHPAARGILFDRPATVAGAGALLQGAGVGDRCAVVGGSFFEAVPAGGDLYVLKSVLHDWDDDRAAAILRTCRRAMGPAGRLLLIERVLPPGNAPSPGRWMDLNMLVAAGGRERTEAEYRSLLAGAGFEATRVVPTTAEVSLLEATPRGRAA
jgi:hypothetical protein